ncbi:hypothetical protein J6590_064419 [Homalodisca vitripennis]|nr:hypothetical protein J6590_064419 [Homalodisca vitripennis]
MFLPSTPGGRQQLITSYVYGRRVEGVVYVSAVYSWGSPAINHVSLVCPPQLLNGLPHPSLSFATGQLSWLQVLCLRSYVYGRRVEGVVYVSAVYSWGSPAINHVSLVCPPQLLNGLPHTSLSSLLGNCPGFRSYVYGEWRGGVVSYVYGRRVEGVVYVSAVYSWGSPAINHVSLVCPPQLLNGLPHPSLSFATGQLSWLQVLCLRRVARGCGVCFCRLQLGVASNKSRQFSLSTSATERSASYIPILRYWATVRVSGLMSTERAEGVVYVSAVYSWGSPAINHVSLVCPPQLLNGLPHHPYPCYCATVLVTGLMSTVGGWRVWCMFLPSTAGGRQQ